MEAADPGLWSGSRRRKKWLEKGQTYLLDLKSLGVGTWNRRQILPRN